jgi:P-type E1-E2 ATPase
VIALDIPGWGSLRLSHGILDLNGTLAVDGEVGEAAAGRVRALSAQVELIIVSADTTGTLARWGQSLGLSVQRAAVAEDKVAALEALRAGGASGVLAVGNGRNDVPVLRAADLGIAVVGHEGAATAAVAAADLVCPSIEDALDLLLRPARLLSGLRA